MTGVIFCEQAGFIDNPDVDNGLTPCAHYGGDWRCSAGKNTGCKYKMKPKRKPANDVHSEDEYLS